MSGKKVKEAMLKAFLCVSFTLFFSIVFFSTTGNCSLITIFGRQFSLSFYISIIAIPLFYFGYFFIFKNHNLNWIIILTALFGVLLFLGSFGVSFFLFNDYAGLFSTNPIMTSIEEMAKYAYDLSLIPYFVFFLSCLKKRFIQSIIYIFLCAWLLFGCFQLLCYLVNSSTLWKFYDSLDFLKILGGTSELFERIRANYGHFRFYGISSEPASNSVIISAFLLPFLCYQAFNHRKRILSLSFDLILMVGVLTFAILTVSSSVFVGLAIDALALVALFFRSKHISKKPKNALLLGAFFIFCLVIAIPPIRDVLINKMLLKLFDTSNYSTQYRYSTIWNDLNCLILSPIFGVGDGNQGYFYAANVSGTWMAQSPETQAAIRGEFGLLNGGAGVPSFISGFGFYGIVLILLYSFAYYKEIKSKTQYLEKLRFIFLIGLLIQLVLMIASSGFHRNYLFFASIALPVICGNNIEDLSGLSAYVMRKNVSKKSSFVKI